MGSTAVTSTGVPQNANPLLAPSRTIHVGNLSPGASPAVLRQIFECIGGVRDVRVAGDGRYGFVDFLDAAAAEAAVAMNGTMVCGAALRVEKAMQPRLFAQSNQPTPLPPAGARDPAAALLAFRATQASALRAGEAGGPAPGAGLAAQYPTKHPAAGPSTHLATSQLFPSGRHDASWVQTFSKAAKNASHCARAEEGGWRRVRAGEEAAVGRTVSMFEKPE